MNILVLGSGGNAGINFCKSILLSDKYKVIGCDIDEYFINHSICSKNYLLPKNIESKKSKLLEIIFKENIKFVHAQPDPEVKFLLSNDEFKSLVYPHSINKLNLFSNKFDCQKQWISSLNLDFKIEKFVDLDESKFNDLLKNNKRVWVRAIRGAGSKAALPVATYTQAKNWITYWVEFKGMSYDDFMICEYLPNEEYAVQTFWKDGVLLHSQARQRIRYVFEGIMPSGQSSTPSVAKTIKNEKVYESAIKFIKCLDTAPNGIYCIDMKTNHDGQIIPTEINYGRFFTTSYFFSVLGVNTPLDYVNSFFGLSAEPKINYLDENIYCIRGLDVEPKILKL